MGTDYDRQRGPHSLTDQELMGLARQGAAELEAVEHDHVANLWDAIAAEAFAGSSDVDSPVAPEAGSAMTETIPDLATERTRRRGGRVLAVASAAAVLVVAVAGGVWVATRPPTPAPIASFEMDALDDRAPTSVAGAIVEVDGQRAVDVDLASLPELSDAYYELWLLDLEAGELVSLGPVDRATNFPVPAAIDVGSFPTIDVSVEPTDGDPAHSGDSVLRGPITASGPDGG